jgi:hypothetical protein
MTFAFCKRHGVLVQKTGEDSAEAVYRAGAQPAAIAEVRRVLGIPLQLRRVDNDDSSSCCGSSSRVERTLPADGQRHG